MAVAAQQQTLCCVAHHLSFDRRQRRSISSIDISTRGEGESEREREGVDRGRWSGREVVDGGGRQLEQLALCVFFF